MKLNQSHELKDNKMQIQLNTDANIEGRDAMATRVSSVVENALRHVSDHITRVEIQLSDQNSDKKGGSNDMRCVGGQQ